MPPYSQMPDLVIEEKPGATKNNLKSKAGAGGLLGLGIITLCGICCSLPLLAGSGLALGGAAVLAFLSAAWPILLGIVVVISALGGIFLVRQTRPRGELSNPTISSGETEACNACNLDGSCGCKK